MVNTDYNNIYSQFSRAKSSERTKGTDKTHMSKNMEYLEKAKEKMNKAKGLPQKEETAVKEKNSKEITQEDIKKLYAEMNGIHYGNSDSNESYRSMANTFLNEMVFSHMGASSELFVPQISRNVLSAAFNTVYDYSDVEKKIMEAKAANDDTGDVTEKD